MESKKTPKLIIKFSEETVDFSEFVQCVLDYKEEKKKKE